MGILHDLEAMAESPIIGMQAQQRDWSPYVAHFTSAKAMKRTTDWGLRLASETAQKLVQRLSFAFSRKVIGIRPVTWETALLREAQRFAEEVSTERRNPRPFAFNLPLPVVQPETLGDRNLTAKIVGLSVPEARKLGIPETTLWYCKGA